MQFCPYETAPHITDPQNSGAVDEILNMGQHWNKESFKKYRNDVIATNKKVSAVFQRAYKYIAAAKLVHDDWSNYNNSSLDRSKLFLLTEDLKNKILSNYEVSTIGTERHLFATAFTSQGIVTFIDNLYEDCEKVYVFNGGPGTGKTKVLNFIYTEALKRGFFVEVYHDPLIPDRIEHIIIPKLKTALITSNEINNKKFTGTQIYVDNFVDYSYIDKDELQKDKHTFYELLNEGLSIIASAKELYDALKVCHVGNMNFNSVDEVYQSLLDKLLEYEKDYLIEQGL